MRDFRAIVRAAIAPLALPPHREQKIIDEWSAQLEDLYDAMRADGATEEDAYREIQRQLPGWQTLDEELHAATAVLARMTPVRRAARARVSWRATVARLRDTVVGGLVRDLRASLRLSTNNPVFTAAVVLTIAICLGANAAIFTVLDVVLLRPLPVPEPHRIVGLGDVYPTITPNDILSNDVPSYFDRRDALTTLEEQGMFTYWFDTFTIDGTPRELRGVKATPSLFRMLQVAPALGRTFTDDEGEIGEEQKIILSDSLWQQLYGGDPQIIGRSIRLAWTGQQYTVVGVMPRDFSFFDHGFPGHAGESRRVQFWLPLAFTSQQKSDGARTRYGFFHLGRLRPGATAQQVQAQLDALHAKNVQRFPQFNFAELGMYSAVTSLQEALTRGVRRPLYLLWAGASFVLVIGVFNLANLALARASARRRELATRYAFGAGRVQVVRQLIVEAMLPAFVGGAAGILLAVMILKALTLTGLEQLPNAHGIRIGAATAGYVAAISMAIGLLLGLVPAAVFRKVAVSHVLSENSRSAAGGRTASVFRRSMIVAQVALSVVLLFAATVLITSVRNLLRVDAGFSATGVVTATIFPPPSRYADQQAFTTLQDRVLEGLRSMPGIHSVGMTSNIALSGYESPATVSTVPPSAANAATVVPSVVAVTPGYFEAMSTPLVRGRTFLASDRADAPRVAIVDERLARRLWQAEEPVGKRIYRGEIGPFTVVGVVRDVRLERLTSSIDSIGTAYFPHTQSPPLGRLRWIAVKSSADTAAVVRSIRAKLLEIDPELALSDVQTMNERTNHALVSERLASSLATGFAAIALLLSIIGIYAVLASVVARRTREIGIRMALGSRVHHIFRMVLTESAVLIGAGLVLGVGGALATARALEGFVVGIDPTDPQVLGAVVAATGGAALLACMAPARRATRINPVDVLSDV